MNSLKTILQSTYQKRQALNSHYSRNAFARDLGISPAALSQFLRDKRSLSKKNRQRIAQSLGVPFEISSQVDTASFSLEMEVFSAIADWYHFAILNLAETDQLKSPSQISKRLGISAETAKQAFNRLKKLKLIQYQDGIWIRTHQRLDTGTDIPSAALRKHNREKMELAIHALEKVNLNERDISSLTLTFNPKQMAVVKKEVMKFKKRISQICQTKLATEVYSLNVQFFPLSQTEIAI